MKMRFAILVTLFITFNIANAQKVIVASVNGVKYAGISAEGMGSHGNEDRSQNPYFYVTLELYPYTADGSGDTPETDASGNIIHVQRIRKHSAYDKLLPDVFNEGTNIPNFGKKISKKFVISPTNVCDDGAPAPAKNGNSQTMNWATANGLLATANTVSASVSSSAVAKGCPMYRGYKNEDPAGTWRTPTAFEYVAIIMLEQQINQTTAETEFVPLLKQSYYWSCTEYAIGTTGSTVRNAFYMGASGSFRTLNSNLNKTSKNYLRCVKDID